jgi:ubiquinone/menaquinone biosynthesis C-methylase UbiE
MERIPPGWEITLSDFSAGMLREAEAQLRDTPHNFTFAVFDAQAIPFAAEHFDVVLAHHMLFFVPDRAWAFGEIGRVLRSGGRLQATTNGNETFKLKELLRCPAHSAI